MPTDTARAPDQAHRTNDANIIQDAVRAESSPAAIRIGPGDPHLPLDFASDPPAAITATVSACSMSPGPPAPTRPR